MDTDKKGPVVATALLRR